jgi:hydroxymethylglutaryl-CoA reductase (NADPH)
MLLWGMCLVYFFGFFGISFLDTEEIVEYSHQLETVHQKHDAQRAVHTAVKSPAVVAPVTKPTKPMNDGPVCSDPTRQKSAAETTGAENVEDIDFTKLSDDEVFEHLLTGALKDYQLEKKLADCGRAVAVRRRLYENVLDKKLDLIPYAGYDYGKVFGANCEIVIGYVPLPLGVVGPLVINGEPIYIPMATTEGCLVASTNRGCKAL